MRISDWSSDVCSSDLVAGAQNLFDEIIALVAPIILDARIDLGAVAEPVRLELGRVEVRMETIITRVDARGDPARIGDDQRLYRRAIGHEHDVAVAPSRPEGDVLQCRKSSV